MVRHVELAGRSLTEVEVLGNRGASGIDGCVSTAKRCWAFSHWGWTELALVGDEALWYDSNALAVPATEQRPDLVIVVADNDGAGIFSTLGRASPLTRGTSNEYSEFRWGCRSRLSRRASVRRCVK